MNQTSDNRSASESERDEFLRDVMAGLLLRPRSIPAKYLYDDLGSSLFDQICELDEYYLTRLEQSILEHDSGEISDRLGKVDTLIELGAGSGSKTRIIMNALARKPAFFVPVDLSSKFLLQCSEKIAAEYPQTTVIPLRSDFDAALRLPEPVLETSGNRAVLFLGSSIGNYSIPLAQKFLSHIAATLGKGGKLLLGFDLVKDRKVLEAAYNDSKGVTAQFNLNLLRRMNRELEADFDLSKFSHQAIYREDAQRIEMHLVSLMDQDVRVWSNNVHFFKGESIHTESSQKFTVEGMANLARLAGFEPVRVWTDPREWFAVGLFTVR